MSDTSQGPGWWLAPDARWYPPEQHPNYVPPPGGGGAPYGWADGNPQVARRGTNGLAVASLVLSIIWLAGLGSLLAVIFGASARRQIRESNGAREGDGIALAGLIIGIVGLVGAVLFWVLVVAIGIGVHRAAQNIQGALSPHTSSLHFGQTATLPSDAGAISSGIASIKVKSLTVPVTSQVPFVQPETGKEFAVAQVEVCAGPGGVQNVLFWLGFDVVFAGGQTDGWTFDARKPGLDDVHALGAGQCGTGYITFEIAAGSSPNAVQYKVGLPNRTYQWTP